MNGDLDLKLGQTTVNLNDLVALKRGHALGPGRLLHVDDEADSWKAELELLTDAICEDLSELLDAKRDREVRLLISKIVSEANERTGSVAQYEIW